MAIEKSHENSFKFGVYQGDSAIIERQFSADYFNPVVRYSVDVREMIPSIISRLQKILSRRNVSFVYDLGNDKDINLLGFYKNELRKYSKFIDNKLEKPQIVTHNINGKIIRGVECKFGLYINDNPIVERNFYVDKYNPASRFSTEIVDVVEMISDEIFEYLKEEDVNHMWNDYDLINIYGLYIHQIRELNNRRRRELIEKKHDRSFVKQVKGYYRSQQRQQHNN
jgi:hypothetical protein